MNARARIGAFFDRSATRGTEQAAAYAPSDAPRGRGSGAPSRGRQAPRLLLGFAAALTLALVLGVTLAAATAPVVMIEDATNVGYTTADVEGTVNPEGQSTSWRFQYATEADFSNAQDGPSGATETSETVSGQLGGLQPNTTYHLRLLAENGDGQSEAVATNTFTTKEVTAPTVSNVEAEDVQYTRAKVKGEVEVANADSAFTATTCRFEYVTQAEWEANSNAFPEPEGAPSAGCGAEPAGPGTTAVEAQLVGLAPKTTYHLRLVTANQGGAGKAEAAGFETLEVTPPSVEALQVSGITSSEAHFAANVDTHSPQGAPAGEAIEEAFGTNWSFSPGFSAGHAEADDEVTAVNGVAEGLEPSTEYTATLHASNAGGSDEESVAFETETVPPLVTAFAAGPIQAQRAGINGEINPQNAPTRYWFEWGGADCSANPCQSIPASKDADAGSGPGFTYVDHELTGLSPETTYHFRLMAENSAGLTEGDDEEFTTASIASESPTCPNPDALGASQLPDCRAWEMVSPPEKNGNDIMPMTDKTHPAVDGSAVAFGSLGTFAGAKGSGVDTEYIAERTEAPGTNGWATHAITPKQDALITAATGRSLVPDFERFSPDLSTAVYRGWAPLTEEPNTALYSKYYLARGLRDAEASPFELLSPAVAPLPAELAFSRPNLAGASTDLSHVYFEAGPNLTQDTQGFPTLESGPPKLYENDEGTLRLAGRVPPPGQSECDDSGATICVAVSSSQSGLTASGANFAYKSGGMVSADGSRVYFQSPVSAQGGRLYERIDGTRTVQVNVSEKSSPESPQLAQLWTASKDGSRVFFTTGEGLVNGDDNGSKDLYMYDNTAPVGSRLTLISDSSESHAVGDVFAASDDGHYVYFGGSGALLPHESQLGGDGMYVWHDGVVRTIGRFANTIDARRDGFRTSTAFQKEIRSSRFTADGRYLLFMVSDGAGFAGHGGFAGYDHGDACHFDSGNFDGSCRELYLYDADSGRLRCVSCNPNAAVATGAAVMQTRIAMGAAVFNTTENNSLSADGRYVFFNTNEKLVPADINGPCPDLYERVGRCADAYEYDTQTGEVHLLSSGESSSAAPFIDATPDGKNVYFATREPLSAWDHDSSYDLYDARVDGGLPEPSPPPPSCQGDACQPAPAQLNDKTPASSSFAGQGNQRSARNRRCAKNRRKVKAGSGKTRCIKRNHHKRTANPNRRAGR